MELKLFKNAPSTVISASENLYEEQNSDKKGSAH